MTTDTPPPTLDVEAIERRAIAANAAMIPPLDIRFAPIVGGKTRRLVVEFVNASINDVPALCQALRDSREEIARLKMVLTESATNLRTISDFGRADDATVDTVLEIIDAALG